MLQFLHKLVLFSIYLFSFYTYSQRKVEDKTSLKTKKETDFKEKSKIDKAFYLFNNNEKDKAYKIAHKLLKKKLAPKTKVNAYLLLSFYFNSSELIDSSLFYGRKALIHKRYIKNDSLQNRLSSLVYNLFALNSKKKGLSEESKKWHLKGIEATQKYNEEDLYYTHTHGLAHAYMNMDDYKKALKLFKLCLKYKGDKEITFGSYINIGIIYSLLKNFKLSNKNLNKALSLSEKNDYATGTIKVNLAKNYEELNDLDKAFLFNKEGLAIAEKKGYNKLAIEARFNIANIYLKLKRYKDAELMFSLSLINAVELGYLNQQRLIYEKLKDISIAKNQYKNAFQFLNRVFSVKDSISKLQKDKEVNELEVKYKTLQKENEITLLKKNQEIQKAELIREKSIKNIILYSFLIILIPVLGLLVIYYQKLQAQNELNRKQEEINNQKISSLIKDQELKVIKASIKGQNKERKYIAQELHDSIGGNLAAIKLKLNSFEKDTMKTAFLNELNSQIDCTYEEVRNISHNLIPKQFNENNFSNILEEYMNSIWGANSSFTVYPREKINLLKEELQIEIFKIIKELTTNTIKHANATNIELQLNIINNELSMLFEDNGVGFISNTNNEGIGFSNIKSRLKKFSGVLHIDSRINRGTIINIEIPLTKEVEDEI
ncbi:tetratricopeptide repeat-containing sensor histidine kinase [Tenacibaculum sp. nBUS_03]|uniref:tetratricopeptide repeat-containing sensor histidine kinase n=1 Tax=Tenacibaculum sp. nBUS_03 TaxID=3395320 RepID=UPI003EBEF8E3